MLGTDVTRGGRSELVASVVAVAVVAMALWLSVGVDGLLVAGAVSVVWSVTRPEYAVGVGGVLYGALLASAEQYAALVAASLAVVFAADVVVRWPERTAAIALFALVSMVAVLSEASRLDATWQGVLAILGGFAVVAYTVHRYALVRLDLVGGIES